MSTSYLLDSSVLVLSLRQDATTLQRLAKAQALYVSSVALGELYHGAAHSVHVEKSLGEVDGIANSMTILVTDSATAKIYGHVKHVQRTKGLMVPDNDLWIASTALQYGLTLAARDNTLPGLPDLLLSSGKRKRRLLWLPHQPGD